MFIDKDLEGPYEKFAMIFAKPREGILAETASLMLGQANRCKISVHAPTVDRTSRCEARVTATYRARRPAGVVG